MPSAKFEADFDQFKGAVAGADATLKGLETTSHQTQAAIVAVGPAGANAFGTLHSGLSEADKTLALFGVHIGPEIRALQEMGDVAGKTAGQIGLIGTAGLAAAAGVAGWKVGRMIADFTGSDAAIGAATAKLLGWGDAAGQAAGATADVLAKATKAAGREITDLTEAMAINTAEAKRLHDSLFTSEARVGRLRAELSLEQHAIRSVTDEQAQLILIGDKQHHTATEMAKDLGIQVAAVSAVIDKEHDHQAAMKQSAEDAKKLADAAADVSAKYTETVARLTDLKSTTAGLDPVVKQSIIEWLKLGGAQADIALAVHKTAGEIKAVATELAATDVATKQWFGSMLKGAAEAMTAQTAMNKAVGLDAHGAILLQATAADTLAARLKELDQAVLSQTSKTTLVKKAEDDFAQALLAEAVASDQAYAASLKKTEANQAQAASVHALTFQMQTYAITAKQAADQELAITNAFKKAGIFQSPIAISNPFGYGTSGARAGGGPVSAGGSYVVGEGGPELFRPSSSGVIVPNGGGGGGTVVYNTFHVVDTESNIARRVADQITRSVLRTRKVSAA